MQKVINVLALASFAVSAAIVGAGAYVYVNQDALKEQAIEAAKEQLGGMIAGQLGQTLLSGPADPVAGMDESGAVPIPAVPFGM